MKTLPTGWAALIDGSFTVAYMVKLDSRDGSTVFRWSTVDTADIGTGSGEEFVPSWIDTAFSVGRIAKGGLGKVRTSIDLSSGGGLGSVGDWQLTLLNQDGFFDSYFLDQWIEQAVIEIRRFILDVAPTTFTDGLTVFKGIVSDYSYDRNNVVLKCIADETEHTVIPRTVISDTTISTADFGATRTIPENTLGKPIPIQFGTIEKAEAVFCNADTTEVEAPSIVTGGGDDYIDDSTKAWTTDQHAGKDLKIIGGEGKGQLVVIESNIATRLTIEDRFQNPPQANGSVYQITDTQFDMIISDEKIKEFTLDDEGDYYVWFFDETSKIYVPANMKILSLKNNLSPFAARAGLQFIAGIVKKNEVTFFFPYPFTELKNTEGWDHPERMIDWDNSTYASYAHTGSTQYLLMGKLGTNLSDVIGTWDKIYLYVVGEHDKAGWAGALEWPMVYKNSGDAVGTYCSLVLSDDALYFNNVLNYLLSPPSGFSAKANANLSEVSADYLGASMITAGDWATLNYNRWFLPAFYPYEVTGDYTIKIYELGLIFAKTVKLNERTRFFAKIKGREYGATWGFRKTWDSLCENSVDIIEKILRSDLNVDGADIDVNNFDTTNTARTESKLAYTIKEPINSLSEIEKICQETMMAYWKNSSGQHTVRALELDVDGPTAIDAGDVLMDEGKNSSFSVRTSPLKDVVNEFYVHFDKDPCLDEYHGLLFVKSPSESVYSADFTNLTIEGERYWALVNESYQRYGVTKTKHIYLNRVTDAVTAEAFLKRLIFWLFLRVPEVSWMEQLQHCDHEIVDQASFTSAHREGNFAISEVSEDLDLDRISFRARFLTDEVAHGIWERILEDNDSRELEESIDTRVTE